MIGKLTGKVEELALDYLILDVNGVGYKVESYAPYRLGLEGRDVALYIHTHVKETELRLFGFQTKLELGLFELLLGVSGVGPKSAMLICSHYSPEQLRQAAVEGDAGRIKVKGVGKKTVSKIMLELKDKLGNLVANAGGGSEVPKFVKAEPKSEVEEEQTELQLALTSLGYSAQEVRNIEAKVDTSVAFSEQIKQALQLL